MSVLTVHVTFVWCRGFKAYLKSKEHGDYKQLMERITKAMAEVPAGFSQCRTELEKAGHLEFAAHIDAIQAHEKRKLELVRFSRSSNIASLLCEMFFV